MRGALGSRILPRRREPAEETPLPAGHREIQREEFSRLFGRMASARLAIGPAVVALAAGLLWFDPTPWRRVTLGLTVTFVAGFFVYEFVRWRRQGFTPGTVPRNLFVAVPFQLLVSGASGGLGSPILPMALPLGMIVGVFLGLRASLALTGLQIAAVWVFAGLHGAGGVPAMNPVPFGGGAGLGAPLAWTVSEAAVLSVLFVFANGIGRAIRGAFERIVARAVAARQESLEAHAQRAEELTAMSAEIAHELKNPLASVKGLAGLLAQGAAEPKARERLAVLRREVDRMQAILDGFLNFSRPLVPLALGDTDVGALCREVAALHEGLARERGAGLEVRAGAVLARCDPRKVKQIVINLVQNALEATPGGGAAAEVEIVAEPLPGGGARVRVEDRGHGLDPALGASLFSPGATTKPHGSGLGLPIARALARQHGGDLTLAAREGGGTVAELTLPGAPGEGGAPGAGRGRAA